MDSSQQALQTNDFFSSNSFSKLWPKTGKYSHGLQTNNWTSFLS